MVSSRALTLIRKMLEEMVADRRNDIEVGKRVEEFTVVEDPQPTRSVLAGKKGALRQRTKCPNSERTCRN